MYCSFAKQNLEKTGEAALELLRRDQGFDPLGFVGPTLIQAHSEVVALSGELGTHYVVR
jgi:hypothetical protein